MSKGESGRLVIEVDPTLKRHLYSALAIENSTLKQWFIESATRYITERERLDLPGIASKKRGAKKP